MRIGIAVTAYNRKNLLLKCLRSLCNINTDMLFVHMIVHNDGGSDFDVQRLAEDYKIINKNIHEVLFINSEVNLKVEGSLLYCFDYLFDKGCELVCNLDGDAIVKENFLQELIYTSRITGSISTGFNTQSKHSNGNIRHLLIANYGRYGLKKTIGGINIMFNKDMYEKIVRPSLEGGSDWDWRMCSIVNFYNQDFGVTLPSVVQHLGQESTFANGHEYDIAEDF
jgi:glycosyltransferase involved in cell wall biosynthesis